MYIYINFIFGYFFSYPDVNIHNISVQNIQPIGTYAKHLCHDKSSRRTIDQARGQRTASHGIPSSNR